MAVKGVVSVRRNSLRTAGCLLSLGSATAFALPSAQLSKLIESIQKEEVEYQSQVLKNQLDGTPLDKKAIPLKDPESGAINIQGETPRDKIVTDLVNKIDAVSEKVREAQTKQDEIFARVRSSSASVAEVIVEFVTESAGKKFFPVNFEVFDKEIKLNKFETLVSRGNTEKITLLRTVLEKGRRTLRIRGIFAIGTFPDEMLFSNRERFYIDQNLELDVQGSKGRFVYRIVEREDLRSLEQIRDKD